MKLADVAWPTMAKQKISCSNIQFLVLVARLTGRLGIDACQQRVNEQGQIAFAITQRRELKYSDRQAVEEVLPKSAAPNLFGKDAIGCGYDPDVDRLGHAGTHAGDLALLQNTKQPHLRSQRKLANLVKKQRPAVRRLKVASPRRSGPCKGPFFMSKQLRIH